MGVRYQILILLFFVPLIAYGQGGLIGCQATGKDTPDHLAQLSDADIRCQAGFQGITAPVCGNNGSFVTPLADGAECARTPVGNNAALGLECADIQNPVVISKCDKGRCVAKIRCDGKPLEGLPEVPIGSGSPDASGGNASSGSGPSGGSPSDGSGGALPHGGDLLGAFKPPSAPPAPSGSDSSPSDRIERPSEGGVSDNELPAVIVGYPDAPIGGTAGIGNGSAAPVTGGGVLSPGGTGVFDRPSNTTFSWQSPVYGATINPNVVQGIVSVVSSLFSSLFSNWFGNSAPTVDGVVPTISTPAPTTPPPPQRPHIPTVARPPAEPPRSLGEMLTSQGNEPLTSKKEQEELQKLFDAAFPPPVIAPVFVSKDSDNLPPGNDRTGLPDPATDFSRSIIENTNNPPVRIPTDVIKNEVVPPDEPSVPEPNGEPLPRPVQVASANDGVLSDASEYASKVTVPDWWPGDLRATYAEALNRGFSGNDAVRQASESYISGVVAGLYSGRLAPGTETTETARRLLQENIDVAIRVRERSYDAQPLGFGEWKDKNLPSLFASSEQQAVDAARVRLDLFARAEGIARLGMLAGTFEPAPPLQESPSVERQGLIVRTNAPIDTTDFVNIFDYSPLTPLRYALAPAVDAVRSWWQGSEPTPVVENRVSDDPSLTTAPGSVQVIPPPTSEVVPPQTFPVTAAPPTDPGRVAVDGVVPPASPEPKTAETPKAPIQPATPPGAPTVEHTRPSAREVIASEGVIRGTAMILSTVLQSVMQALVRNLQSENVEPPAGASAPPAPVVGSASIRGDPARVERGQRTNLIWSSENTQGCAVINDRFEVLMRGLGSGEVMSPRLATSTRFGVICNITDAKDKFMDETLVRVIGDDTNPPRIFPKVGKASNLSSSPSLSNTSGTAGFSGGTTANPAPQDVRTCDPELPIHDYIVCLCVAEPNPAGCSLVPKPQF